MKKVAVLLLMFISGLGVFGQASTLLPNSIQLPQVNGTSSVDSAKNGMLIYNTPDQSLYYRKASEWAKISNTTNNSVVSTTTIYYKVISNPSIPGEITQGPHNGQTLIKSLDYTAESQISIMQGGVNQSAVNPSPVTFTKSRGPNFLSFMRNMVTKMPMTSVEFLFYNETDQLYFSIKLTSVFVERIDKLESDDTEKISLFYTKIGWRDSSGAPTIQGTFDAAANTWSSTY